MPDKLRPSDGHVHQRGDWTEAEKREFHQKRAPLANPREWPPTWGNAGTSSASGAEYVMGSYKLDDNLRAIAGKEPLPVAPNPERERLWKGVQWAAVPPSLVVPEGVSALPLTETSPRGSVRSKAFP